MKHKNQIQQGDVILKRVAELPKEASLVKQDPRGIVLAEGEATGHCHRIESPSKGLNLYKIDDLLWLENSGTESVSVTHEEHDPVTVPPGIYKVGRVRRYDYFSQMSRRVED